MSRVGEVRIGVILAAILGVVSARGARAESDPIVARAIQSLRGSALNQRVGESALIGLALLKAEVPENDPTLSGCINKILQRFSGAYLPERTGGHDVYEAAVVSMLLANLEGGAKQSTVSAIAQYLISKQKANGCWDYDSGTTGDTSISQYAVLGLWEAENAGANVPPGVWDRAAQWFLSVQHGTGSWNYHPGDAMYRETVAMTAAGVGSLLICKRQLSRHRQSGDSPSGLLVALKPEGPSGPYEVQTSMARIDQAARAGLSWLAANFTASSSPVVGPSPYYALYGIERIGALADRSTLGRINWFEQGRAFIQATQSSTGTWSSAHGVEVNTAWAVLFLTRSTAKSLRRIEIKRLGAGTLLGGRGLPKDLSAMTVAGGRVVARPMNGAVEGMLAVLEDPRAQDAGSALSGLVTRYEEQGPRVLRPHKDRFRKLLTDRDPGLRRVAAWALGRTADLDVVPALIGALTDPDEDVVDAARISLQLLSRKINGLGPPPASTPEQRREAARRWKDWYEAIRPLGLEGQDDEDSGGPATNPTTPTARSTR